MSLLKSITALVERQSVARKQSASLGVMQLEDRLVPSFSTSTVASALTHSVESYTNLVTSAYQQFLGRAPDQAGAKAWVSSLERGLNSERLESAFVASAEYIQKHGGLGAGWLKALYQDVLGRTADASGLRAWLGVLGAGTDASQIGLAFSASPERRGQRITSYYETYLERDPASKEVNDWLGALAAGLTNEDVTAGFLASAEYYNQISADDPNLWLANAYGDELGRSPEDAAFTTWVGRPADVDLRHPKSWSTVIQVENPIWTSTGALNVCKPEADQGCGGFGTRRDGGRRHQGIDITATEGITEVHAIADGEVTGSVSNWKKLSTAA